MGFRAVESPLVYGELAFFPLLTTLPTLTFKARAKKAADRRTAARKAVATKKREKSESILKALTVQLGKVTHDLYFLWMFS